MVFDGRLTMNDRLRWRLVEATNVESATVGVRTGNVFEFENAAGGLLGPSDYAVPIDAMLRRPTSPPAAK